MNLIPTRYDSRASGFTRSHREPCKAQTIAGVSIWREIWGSTATRRSPASWTGNSLIKTTSMSSPARSILPVRRYLTAPSYFQGKTFEVGLTTHSSLDSPLYGFGYQYDIIRRKRGHLGLAFQLNLFDTKASISAAAQTSGGVPHPAVSASNSLLAPIPVAGPEFRLYLTNSPRLFVEGNVYGMYFFGYGNYVSAAGSVGVTVAKHLSLNAGYQLGTRLVVNNDSSNDRIGLRMTQKGPIAGVQLSF